MLMGANARTPRETGWGEDFGENALDGGSLSPRNFAI